MEQDKPKDKPEFTAGYNAQVQNKNLVQDNPHEHGTPDYWEWRSGYLQAFNDSH
jgi:hypothetical protein